MSFFDLRILITPLVSSNSSQNNHIIYTKETIVERMVGEGGGVFIRCNKQQSLVSLKEDNKISNWLSSNHLSTVVDPITVFIICP
jgi:hypothetical protein